MPIKFSCTHCQCVMTVPDDLAGKRGKCSKCKKPVIVPQPAGAPTSAPAPAPPTSAAPPPSAPAKASPQPEPQAKPKLPPSRPTPAKKPEGPPANGPAPADGATRPTGDTTTHVNGLPASKNGEAPPERSLAEIEADAAALLRDEPKEEEVEVKVIDFECDYCSAPLQMPVDMAGKRAPCPECRRIIKVPPLQPKKKLDWKTAANVPSGAKMPDVPAPDGEWGSTTTKTGVHQESLEEAGAIKKEPRTLGQKIRLVAFVVVILGIISLGTWGTWSWATAGRDENALQLALNYAEPKAPEPPRPSWWKRIWSSPSTVPKAKEQGPPPPPAAPGILAATGRYYARLNQAGCAEKAREYFGKTITLSGRLTEGERDMLLAEVARDQITLGGEGPSVREGKTLPWNDVQKGARAALAAISNHEARLDALRGVSRELIAHKQAARVLPLANQAFPAPEVDHLEAQAVAAIELFRAGRKDEASKAYEQIATAYAAKERPELRPAVVALAIVLGRDAPTPGKGGLDEEINRLVGKAEGEALAGRWEDARKTAGGARTADANVRAFGAVVRASLDAKNDDAKTDVAQGIDSTQRLREIDRKTLSFVLFTQARQAIRAGLSDDQVQAAVAAIPDRGLRAWAQLEAMRSKLAGSKGTVDEKVIEGVDPASLSGLLARMELARHNVRADSGYRNTVRGWSGEAVQAFGQMGVALGLHKD